jgi:hypothetical protein
MLRQQGHVENIGVYAVGQWEIDDAVFAAEGDGWLGSNGCQYAQSLAGPSTHNHCQDSHGYLSFWGAV